MLLGALRTGSIFDSFAENRYNKNNVWWCDNVGIYTHISVEAEHLRANKNRKGKIWEKILSVQGICRAMF